jgi:putative FmdB family regulatory protein
MEKLQRMSDVSLTDCPDCGEAKLNRLVSAAGFRLKGAGWYETDFKKDGKKNLHESASGEASSKSNGVANGAAPKEPAKPAETKKTESKPAGKKPDAA